MGGKSLREDRNDDSETDEAGTARTESPESSVTTGADVLQRIDDESTLSPPGIEGPTDSGPDTDQDIESEFGVEIEKPAQAAQLQRLAETNGTETVREWADEGMPVEAMGTPSKMEAYRQRKDSPVPWDAEQRNEQSKRRNRLVQRTEQGTHAGDAQVPDSVRDVISSQGQSLDTSVQRAMEDRMGDSFSDVQVHTGPKAAQAADDINAKAFTVGNNIAFNSGEYDPSSPEGQHVIAHELAHVRQQTGGAVSMLPQDDVELEIDPDPELEKEAEETAQRVMQGGDLGIQRMEDTAVHIQRFGGMLSAAWESTKATADIMNTQKQAEEEIKKDRAESFASMGRAPDEGAGASALEERVSALEENVNQLGKFVSEQVAPQDDTKAQVGTGMLWEGTKKGIELGALGLGMSAAGPLGGLGAAMIAAGGLETVKSGTPDMKSLMGGLLSDKQQAMDQDQTGGQNPGR